MDMYNTATLAEVLRHQRTIKPFWLQFFPTQLNFDTEEIFFDKVYEDTRYLAPFVVPNVQGRVMNVGGYESRSFRPAYVKPKHVVDPSMTIERQAGETPYIGTLSPAQRRDAIVAQLLARQKQLLQNRNEWLAAKALIDGTVTIAGEDYPSTAVDFRRSATLSYTLAGAARWSQSGADPLGDLKTARQNVYNRSGSKVTKHIFGADAWEYMNARVDLKELMNRNYGGSETNVNRVGLDDGYEGQEYMGTIAGLNGAGRIEVWVDTSKYKDENGNEQFFLEQNTVVGVGDVQGKRCFGAIRDFKAELKAMETFPKMWQQEDPSVEYIMTQSAPLMVPRNPDASFKILVHS